MPSHQSLQSELEQIHRQCEEQRRELGDRNSTVRTLTAEVLLCFSYQYIHSPLFFPICFVELSIRGTNSTNGISADHSRHGTTRLAENAGENQGVSVMLFIALHSPPCYQNVESDRNRLEVHTIDLERELAEKQARLADFMDEKNRLALDNQRLQNELKLMDSLRERCQVISETSILLMICVIIITYLLLSHQYLEAHQSKGQDHVSVMQSRLQELERQLSDNQRMVAEQDEKIHQLEADVSLGEQIASVAYVSPPCRIDVSPIELV